MAYEYLTDRLVLRVPDPSAAPTVLDYYVRNRDFLKAWEPQRDAAFYTVPYHEQILRKDLADFEKKESMRLWISRKGEEDRFIGCIAFTGIIRGAFHSCFLGYKSDVQSQHNGYITESLRKGIDLIFNEFKLHRIEANIMPRNKRSFDVVKKLGFQSEGLALRYLKINDVWEDHIHMVLLNDNMT